MDDFIPPILILLGVITVAIALILLFGSHWALLFVGLIALLLGFAAGAQ